MTVRNKTLLICALIGGIFGLMTLDLEGMSNFAEILFLIPGMLMAMVFSGNVHVFESWIAAIANWLFYFLLCWVVTSIWHRLRNRNQART